MVAVMLSTSAVAELVGSPGLWLSGVFIVIVFAAHAQMIRLSEIRRKAMLLMLLLALLAVPLFAFDLARDCENADWVEWVFWMCYL